MSAKLMGAVFELDLPPLEKSTLLAMADHAQDDGTGAYPSVERLAAKTGFGERAVRKAINSLRDRGILEAVAYMNGGRGHAVEYEIDITKGARHAYFTHGKGARSSVKGAPRSIKGAPGAPETSLTIKEPFTSAVCQPLELPMPEPEPARKEKRKSGKQDKQGMFPLAQALAEVCNMDLRMNEGELFSEAKRLSKGATPEEIRAHYGPGCWWYSSDWRGLKGQPPRPADVRHEWGKWNAPAGAQTIKPEVGPRSSGRKGDDAGGWPGMR